MNDFFEGLAARSIGATALRPRVASAYESHDAIELIEEVPAMTTAPREIRTAETPQLESPASPAEPVIMRDVVLTRTETQEPPAAAIHEERVEQRIARIREQRVREQTHEHTHHQERIERVREVLAAADVADSRTETSPASSGFHDSGESPVTTPAPAPPRRQPQEAARIHPHVQQQTPLFHRPPPGVERRRAVTNPIANQASANQAFASQASANQASASQPQSDPIVRITIGRVEVRAVQPAQQPPRPAPPPVAAGPTLAEFLEQRERRK